MTEAIGVFYKQLKADVEELSKKAQDKRKLMDMLRTQCDHKYESDGECYHKREEYFKCIYCEDRF